MVDIPTPPVEEAEIVSETTTTTQMQSATTNAQAPAFDINAYNATLEIVRRRLTILGKTQEELKKLNEMYNDIFNNDGFYVDADKVVKDALKRKKEVKAQLAKQPQAMELNGKIKDLKDQIKMNQESLSAELMEYYKTSGVTEIETEDGDVQEFKIVVKLKAKKRAEK